jgi:TRAP-type C4-dicarboxylate transport system substrate-binding protein
MLRVRFLVVAVAIALVVLPAAPRAQNTGLKLATIVPDGSIWDKALKQMGADWGKATGGRVATTVYSGGTQGDDPTVLRKIRVNALQAASLTAVGLANVDWSFNVFNLPFFFENYDELNAVLEKLTPVLKQRAESKGFVLVHWGHAGWLQVFSKRPVQTLAELKGIKLYTSAGDDRMTQWYKANGFQPRAMAMTDILTGLSTGLIDGMPSTPLASMAYQWHKQTPYMLDIGLAPFIGATVVAKRSWDSISAADRAEMLKVSAGVEQMLRVEVPKGDALAVAMMGAQGLKVTKATGAEWRQEAEVLLKSMRGQMVPPDIFDLAVKERDAYRKSKPAAVR